MWSTDRAFPGHVSPQHRRERSAPPTPLDGWETEARGCCLPWWRASAAGQGGTDTDRRSSWSRTHAHPWRGHWVIPASKPPASQPLRAHPSALVTVLAQMCPVFATNSRALHRLGAMFFPFLSPTTCLPTRHGVWPVFLNGEDACHGTRSGPESERPAQGTLCLDQRVDAPTERPLDTWPLPAPNWPRPTTSAPNSCAQPSGATPTGLTSLPFLQAARTPRSPSSWPSFRPTARAR